MVAQSVPQPHQKINEINTIHAAADTRTVSNKPYGQADSCLVFSRLRKTDCPTYRTIDMYRPANISRPPSSTVQSDLMSELPVISIVFPTILRHFDCVVVAELPA